jgi:hypothetical protein
MRITPDKFLIRHTFVSLPAILPVMTLSTPHGRESICPVIIDRANNKAYPASAFIRLYRAQAGGENMNFSFIRSLNIVHLFYLKEVS